MRAPPSEVPPYKSSHEISAGQIAKETPIKPRFVDRHRVESGIHQESLTFQHFDSHGTTGDVQSKPGRQTRPYYT
jgi:hypothetical protein